MSRSYRIAVAETLRRHVVVGDGVKTTLEILPILPLERMVALLAVELEAIGFELDGDVCRRDDDGVEIEVDLRHGTVTVKLGDEADISLRHEGSAATYDPKQLEAAAEQRRAQLKRRLEVEADAQEEELRQKVSSALEAKLRDLQLELDAAVNRATAAALKEKAAQLGEIEEISEDAETGSLTIRVRV